MSQNKQDQNQNNLNSSSETLPAREQCGLDDSTRGRFTDANDGGGGGSAVSGGNSEGDNESKRIYDSDIKSSMGSLFEPYSISEFDSWPNLDQISSTISQDMKPFDYPAYFSDSQQHIHPYIQGQHHLPQEHNQSHNNVDDHKYNNITGSSMIPSGSAPSTSSVNEIVGIATSILNMNDCTDDAQYNVCAKQRRNDSKKPDSILESSTNLNVSQRKQARRACIICQRLKRPCNNERPCRRCVDSGRAAFCQDRPRKPRPSGIKRGPYKTRRQKEKQELEMKFEAARKQGQTHIRSRHQSPQQQQQSSQQEASPNKRTPNINSTVISPQTHHLFGMQKSPSSTSDQFINFFRSQHTHQQSTEPKNNQERSFNSNAEIPSSLTGNEIFARKQNLNNDALKLAKSQTFHSLGHFPSQARPRLTGIAESQMNKHQTRHSQPNLGYGLGSAIFDQSFIFPRSRNKPQRELENGPQDLSNQNCQQNNPAFTQSLSFLNGANAHNTQPDSSSNTLFDSASNDINFILQSYMPNSRISAQNDCCTNISPSEPCSLNSNLSNTELSMLNFNDLLDGQIGSNSTLQHQEHHNHQLSQPQPPFHNISDSRLSPMNTSGLSVSATPPATNHILDRYYYQMMMNSMDGGEPGDNEDFMDNGGSSSFAVVSSKSANE